MSLLHTLTRLYLERYYAAEGLASEAGFETSTGAVLALVATTQIFFCPLGPLFLAAYAFGVTGFATAFEWDMLFPDRRDYLVLTPFPIRVRDLFCAKIASLVIFLSTVMAAVHAYVPFVLIGMANQQATLAGALCELAGQIGATVCASAFGFLCVAAFQGIWISLCSPLAWRRISPWLQMFAMCLMVLAVLLFPVYSLAVRFFPSGHAGWVWWIPPYWFRGVAALFGPTSSPQLETLGVFGLKALGFALSAFCITWTAGYARHYRLTLETQDMVTPRRRMRTRLFDGLLGSSEARAIFEFTGQTLARSRKHRLFLATYLSAGLSLGVFAAVIVTREGIRVSPGGLRSLSALIVFFVVSGFRGAFQFPAELPANWLFQLSESGWENASGSAVRLRVLVSGLAPALVLIAPLEIGTWGLPSGLLHLALQAVAGLLLIEVLFYSFDKIPFACSYYPGGLNLIFLAIAYLYGLTTYSFQIADLEAWLDSRPFAALACLPLAAMAWAALRRDRARRVSTIRFDGGEPTIQTLDLS